MMPLPKLSDIPDSAFYCVECGPTNVGLDCDLPGHGEFALLADLAARECPLCPPWVECAHFGDQCVRLDAGCWDKHRPTCALCRKYPGPSKLFYVWWGELGDEPREFSESPCWTGRKWLQRDAGVDFDTEAEARAEFERRVALMLGREAS